PPRGAAPPPPPAPPAGAGARPAAAADLAKGSTDGPPSGGWKLVFDRTGAWELDPHGSGVVSEYDVHGGIVDAYAPIQMQPFTDGRRGVSMFGHHGIGGTDCTAAGPFGSYSWSVKGDQLTLSARHEGCNNRQAIWEGTWTRTRS